MTIQNRRPFPRRGAAPAWVALVIALGAGLGGVRAAGGHHRLEAGGFGAIGGTVAGKARKIVGESGSSLAHSRSSGESSDLIGGLVGQSFSPRAAATLGTVSVEYQGVAFPLASGDGAVSSVLADLGEPDVASWRLGRWSTADSAYVEAADGGLETIERGHGYFIITAEDEEIEQEGLTTPTSDFEIELEDGPGGRPGYNQLGNPFLFPIPVEELLVTDGSVTHRLTSPENTLTESAIKVYESEDGSYVTNPDVVDPLEAFWVRKLAPGPVSVVVPFAAALVEPEKAPSGNPAGASWSVTLRASQGRRASERLMLGAAPGAAEGWNPLCVSRAPDPPGGALSLFVQESGWGRLNGDYVRSFRSSRPAMSWDVTLQGAESPGEIALRADALDLPAGASITLTDLATGRAHTLASGGGATLAARRDLRLRVSIELQPTPGAGAAPIDALRGVYPNPFRGRSGLVFSHSGVGAIEARVFDVSGRLVRRLSASATAAGERVLVWDGKSDGGAPAAPGVYLARYRVGTAEGAVRLVKLD